MSRSHFLFIYFLVLFFTFYFSSEPIQARASISPEEAINFVGTPQTVCGKVASTKYLSNNSKAPTFLNLNRPYPDQVFTALIWGENRGKFQYPPEIFLANKAIYVSGTIETYKGRAEIIVSESSQITMGR
jgi:hypothetical protein